MRSLLSNRHARSDPRTGISQSPLFLKGLLPQIENGGERGAIADHDHFVQRYLQSDLMLRSIPDAYQGLFSIVLSDRQNN